MSLILPLFCNAAETTFLFTYHNAGSLGTPYRIGLIDKGDGTYDVKNGLMPPNGEQYGSVMKEVFGPLDELYQQYTSDNADTLEPIRVFPSSDELWEMYLKAANI